MIVAAHQPHYLPWLGYLHKIAKADVFVVMDDLQYEAQNFQNRNRIKVNNGTTWLTVPLVHGPQSDRILDKRINNHASPKEHWQRRTWMTLLTHYRRAPFFSVYADALEHVYTRPWTSLIELDLHFLKLFMEWFALDRPVVLASSLSLTGARSERIVDLCKKVGASAYLSGAGGSRGYLDETLFAREHIGLEWQAFEHPRYPQRYPALGFVPNLAALDLALNCGPAFCRAVLGGQAPAEQRPRVSTIEVLHESVLRG